MKKIILYTILIFIISSCRNTPNTTTSQAANPLSNRDPKVGLSPDERFGELFDSVQMHLLFPDAKTFLDCVPITTTDSIMAAFKEAKSTPNFSLQDFVNQWFIVPKPSGDTYTSDLLAAPEDHVNDLWKVLLRPADTFNLGTLLSLPKPYIIGNGRAREVYYKDAYFIMLGLQAAGKVDLMQNMVDNFAYLINTEGYIPLGNRTYYLGRSGSPFFACMVQLLAAEKGESVITHYLPQLENEYNFWMDGAQKEAPKEMFTKNRVVQVDRNSLNRYYDKYDTPRPENYKNDRDSVKKSNRPEKDTYRHIRAATESGWDLSSRWLDDKQKISTVHTSDIVPIDLNALMYNLEMTISKGKIIEKKFEEATEYEKKAFRRREALMRYCWSESKGMFFDFDWQKYRQTEVVSAAMAYPLFFKMVTKREADRVVAAIQQNLVRAGGIVTTTNNTGQAWDAPYGYAPLQWMTIRGLRNYGHEETANDIKKRWCDLNAKVFKATGKMLEKYNVEDLTIESGGGDYPVHDGYGWTNGVLLKLLMEK